MDTPWACLIWAAQRLLVKVTFKEWKKHPRWVDPDRLHKCRVFKGLQLSKQKNVLHNWWHTRGWRHERSIAPIWHKTYIFWVRGPPSKKIVVRAVGQGMKGGGSFAPPDFSPNRSKTSFLDVPNVHITIYPNQIFRPSVRPVVCTLRVIVTTELTT